MADNKETIKKKLSGFQNRKRKAEKDTLFEQTKKCMNINKYLTKETYKSTSVSKSEIRTLIPKYKKEVSVNVSSASDSKQLDSDETKQSLLDDQSIISLPESSEFSSVQNQHTASASFTDETITKNLTQNYDVFDLATWPKVLNMAIIDHIIIFGPSQIHLSEFPKDDKGRHFSSTHYSRKLSNEETIQRRWLVYSVTSNSVFCYCCRIFDSKSISNLASIEGFKKWRHLSDALKMHENSPAHKNALTQWIEAEIRLKTGSTVDKEEQKIISKESLRWNNVLQRLMHITLYLAENNMAFRGSSDKLFTPNNGKFLGLIELLAKFDPIMEEHVKLAVKGHLADHYCGKNIQNELIELMASKVKSIILSRIQDSKYYAIIADCTPDISHKEQLSLTLRCTDITEDAVSIKEYFIGFLETDGTTGAGLTEIILKTLNGNGLNISDCRGQGYDNGANMKGKNNGVQKRITDLNPLAFFMPCGCHSYNLVLSDAAKTSLSSISLFGILQRLFTLFAASVNRWSILIEHLNIFTLKKLSDTRWEARIESVTAVRYQYCEVYNALVSLADATKESDAATSHEATTLGKQLKKFNFIVSLITWYDILFQINVVSKASQSIKIDFVQFTEMLKKCCSYLENYREKGFIQAIITATEIASDLNVEPIFKSQTRLRRVKCRPGEKSVDEPIIDPQKRFEVQFFNVLLDTVLMSMRERFRQLQDFSLVWSFLFDIKKHQNKEELMKHCSALQEKLTVNDKSDIDGNLLCDEILSLQHFLNDSHSTPIEALNFIKKHNLQELFPNVWITLRILLTIPVTVASGERSFSKLKLIKTYLRSTMSQVRLTSLATLSIENEVAANVDFSNLIKEFSDRKARKVKFC